MPRLEPPRAAAPGGDDDQRLDLLGCFLAGHGVAVGADVDQGLVGEAEGQEPDAAADLDEAVVGDLLLKVEVVGEERRSRDEVERGGGELTFFRKKVQRTLDLVTVN